MKKNHIIKVLLTLIGSFGASNLVFAASTTCTTSIKVEVSDISEDCNKDNHYKYIFEAVIYERDKGCVLTGADWASSLMEGDNLSGADLSEADLSRASMNWAIFYKADLSGVDLSWARLYNVDLRGAYLHGADLRGAYLHGVDLRGADLLEVKNLDKASITGIKCDENTVFPKDFLPLSKHSIQCENSAEKTSE